MHVCYMCGHKISAVVALLYCEAVFSFSATDLTAFSQSIFGFWAYHPQLSTTGDCTHLIRHYWCQSPLRQHAMAHFPPSWHAARAPCLPDRRWREKVLQVEVLLSSGVIFTHAVLPLGCCVRACIARRPVQWGPPDHIQQESWVPEDAKTNIQHQRNAHFVVRVQGQKCLGTNTETITCFGEQSET